MSYHCTTCLRTYNSYPSYWGHKRYCKTTTEQPNKVQSDIGYSNTEYPVDLESMYVSMFCLILLKISILPQYRGTKYADGIGKLDELIKKFPHSQSMPVKTKRFGSGISIYIPSLLDQKTKVTGYGHIGLIDSEDIPLLFLQVLFCKHFFTKFINIFIIFSKHSF